MSAESVDGAGGPGGDDGTHPHHPVPASSPFVTGVTKCPFGALIGEVRAA